MARKTTIRSAVKNKALHSMRRDGKGVWESAEKHVEEYWDQLTDEDKMELAKEAVAGYLKRMTTLLEDAGRS